MCLAPHTPRLRESLTREHKLEGDLGFLQQGLHVAAEELQGLALATTRVQQHQHAAGPGETPGAARCGGTNRRRVLRRPLGGPDGIAPPG